MTTPNLHNPASVQKFEPDAVVGPYQKPLISWTNSNSVIVPTLPMHSYKNNTSTDCSALRIQDCSTVIFNDKILPHIDDSNSSRKLQMALDQPWVTNRIQDMVSRGHECSVHSVSLTNRNQEIGECVIRNPVVTHTHDVNTNQVYNPDRNYIITMPWFHGMISRDTAEQLLQPRKDGLFLVRESTNFPGDYTLCVCWQNKVEHYRVKYHDNQLTIDDEEFFENLNQLVEHYQKDADGLCTQLIQCVPKDTKHDCWNNDIDSEYILCSQVMKTFCVDTTTFEGCVIPEHEIEFREPLGKGEFGEVLLGMWKDQRVAVKMLKDSSEAAQQFWDEANLMKSLHHENLVNLLGVVVNNKHIYLITEYMSKGNLVDYLRSRGRLHVTKKDQINFAYDTSAGMEFLEQKKVVHRDLAARNVLISENGNAKVSDFGLARVEKFAPETAKLPIKWTAPEALKHNKFSNKSDMWSFGILLWEIYSFGRVPYSRIPLADVVKHVEKGYKMEAPEGCPPEVYEIMRQAWDLNPDKRPTFEDVKTKLEHLKCIT